VWRVGGTKPRASTPACRSPSRPPALQLLQVKGAMKKGTTGRKIGPTRILAGFHEDGQPLSLKVTVRDV
jgi:hypothetical protein